MTELSRPLDWRRAGSCSGGNCVEVAKVGDRYLVRDSREPDAKPLQFSAGEWAAFVAGVRDGDFEFE